MRQIIRKCFFVWDFEKEEKWLNEMAAKGLGLVSVGFCKYEFEDCMPGAYRVCLQLLDKRPCHPESKKYIDFLETTGAEHVGSFLRWAYFRKKANEGDFEIFSDNASRIKYVTGIISSVSLITIANLVIGINNVFIAAAFQSSFNYVGILNLLLGLFGTWGVIRLLRKRKKMKQEGQLFE